MNSKSFLTKSLVFLTLVFTLVSCGKDQQQFMKDIHIATYSQDTDVYVSVDAKLNLGAMQLPAISLPIKNPKTGVDLGLVEMGVVAGGSNFLKLAFNLSSVTNLSASKGQLPNGNSLPLIATNQVIEIPIGGNKAIKLYISFVDGAQAIGIAVPIKSFDGIGGSVGNTSLFPIFSIENVLGSAGLFTSSTAGQNGFGVFVDLTNILNDVLKRELAARTSHLEVGVRSFARSRFASSISSIKGELDYSAKTVSSRKKRKINKRIYRLHRKRTRLHLK
jgi:hypothetical protein